MASCLKVACFTSILVLLQVVQNPVFHVEKFDFLIYIRHVR